MALTSVIAHRIYRRSPDSAFELQLREQAFDNSGKIEELAYELKSQFIRKGGKSYGRFSDDIGECPFPAWLRDYREERLSFTSFTHKTMQQFLHTLEKAESVLNAYVFFVEEKLEIGDTLGIYLVEHQSGLYLDGDLAIEDSLFLDTNGFTLAAKIQFLRLKGFTVVATSPRATITLDQAKLKRKVALLFGNEGGGVGPNLVAQADETVRIPMRGKVESLNVAVAHGLLAYDLMKLQG